MSLQLKKLSEIKESKGLFEIMAKVIYTWKSMKDMGKGKGGVCVCVN